MKNPVRTSDGVVQWNCIWFGNYPQSDASGVRKEPIKWRVLQVNGNDAFLLADQCLAAQPFHYRGDEDVTWETCSLRAWLNREFWDKAFSAEEQKAIIPTTVKTNGTFVSNFDDGIRTTERVFLLAIDDVINPAYGFSEYMIDEARATKHTAFSESAPEKTMDYEMDWWWLRTSGFGSMELCASLVREDGVAAVNAYIAYVKGFKVRPALHLDLSSSVWSDADVLIIGLKGDMNVNQTHLDNRTKLFDMFITREAMKKPADRESLILVAKHGYRPLFRRMAVEKLDDRETLIHCALHDDSADVRITALKKLDDQETLIHVARHDDSSDVRRTALGKLDDQETLIYCALYDDSETNRFRAILRVGDAQTVIHIALNDSSWRLRIAAVRRLDDRETLIKVASNDCSERVREAAKDRLKSLED